MANTKPFKPADNESSSRGVEPTFGGATERINPIVFLADLSSSDFDYQSPMFQWGISKYAEGLLAEEQESSITGNKYYVEVVVFSGKQEVVCKFTPVSDLVGMSFYMPFNGGPTLLEDAIAFAKNQILAFREKMAAENKLTSPGLIVIVGDTQPSDENGKYGETIRHNGVVIEKRRYGIDPMLAEEIKQSCEDKHGINYVVISIGEDINEVVAAQLAGGVEANVKVVNLDDDISIAEAVGDIAMAATQLSSEPTGASLNSLFDFEGRFTGTNSHDFKFVS